MTDSPTDHDPQPSSEPEDDRPRVMSGDGPRRVLDPEQAIEKELASRREELRAAESAKAHAETQVRDVHVQIKDLETQLSDLRKAKSEYEAAYPELRAKDTACREFLLNETKCLEQILGDKVRDVQRAVAECKHEVSDADGAVKSAAAELTALESRRADAKSRRDAANATLEALRKIVATIEARHKRLEAIKKEAKAAHDEGQYGVAYWLLVMTREFHDVLEESPEVLSPEALPDRLRAASQAHAGAEQAYGDADRALQTQAAKLAGLQSTLEGLKKNLKSNIRKKLGSLDNTRVKAA